VCHWIRTLGWTEHALTRLAEIEKARSALKELFRMAHVLASGEQSDLQARRSFPGRRRLI
jgi:hypothetical protein